jgi:hypothetical protein
LDERSKVCVQHVKNLVRADSMTMNWYDPVTGFEVKKFKGYVGGLSTVKVTTAKKRARRARTDSPDLDSAAAAAESRPSRGLFSWL